MAIEKLRALAWEETSNFTGSITASGQIASRVKDISLDIGIDAKDYDYTKSGFFGFKKLVGTANQRFWSGTTLKFTTYLTPQGNNSTALATTDTMLLALLYNALGGSVAPTPQTATVLGGLNAGVSGYDVMSVSTNMSASFPAGSAVYINATTSIADQVRWITGTTVSANTSTHTLSRAIAANALTRLATISPALTLYSRDSLPAQWLSFEVVGHAADADASTEFDDSANTHDDAYTLTGCKVSGCVIKLKTGEAPVIDWTLSVGKVTKNALSELLVLSSGLEVLNINSLENDPLPSTYLGVYLTSEPTVTATATDGTAGRWTLLPCEEIEIDLGMSVTPKKDMSSANGLSDFILSDRQIKVKLKPYYTEAFEADYLDQQEYSLEIVGPHLDATGLQNHFAIRIPSMALVDYPKRADIEGQHALDLNFAATYSTVDIDDQASGSTTTSCERNHPTRPIDADFRIAFV